jgi:hypothetical protein
MHPWEFKTDAGACLAVFSVCAMSPSPLPKDRGTVIAQAVGGSPTGDVRGAPTSLVGDSAGVAPHQTA